MPSPAQEVKGDRRRAGRTPGTGIRRLVDQSYDARTNRPARERVGTSTKGGVMAVATSVPRGPSSVAGPPAQRRHARRQGPPAPASRIWSTRRALALSRPGGSSRVASRGARTPGKPPRRAAAPGTRRGRTQADPFHPQPGEVQSRLAAKNLKTVSRSVPGPELPRRQPAEAPARPGKRRRCAILEPWHQPDRATAARPAGRATPPRPGPAARNQPAARVRGLSSTAAADRQSPAWSADEHCPDARPRSPTRVILPRAPMQAATSGRRSRTTRPRGATPRAASVDMISVVAGQDVRIENRTSPPTHQGSPRQSDRQHDQCDRGQPGKRVGPQRVATIWNPRVLSKPRTRGAAGSARLIMNTR